MPAPRSAKPASGYEVARAGGKCAVSGQPIAPGEKFMAALRDTPAGFERLDIRLEHWEGFARQDLLGFWQATMPHPNEKKRVFVDDATLCSIFEQLQESDQAPKLAFGFVLGLILMRKRLLNYESSELIDGRSWWTVRLRGRAEPMRLLDPQLDESNLRQVSEQLDAILSGDWP